MKYSIIYILIILTFISCGKEKFSANKISNKYDTTPTQKLDFPGREYSKFTTVKPKVDFLFLWDNSSSTKLISNETRYAMANTINLISENFDYRIILSPLLGDEIPNPFWESYIVSEDSSYVPSNLLSRWTRPGYGAEAIFNLVPKGSLENGITRAFKLTSAGFTNGIFRQGAHMIMIVLSNGDDNSWMADSNYYSGIGQSNYVDDYANKFKTLRDAKSSKTFRFLSVVAHSPCAGSKTGTTYKAMSAKLFSIQQQSGFPANPQSGSPDSFDFCNMQSFYRLFDGINAAISPENIPYKYNYWPITTNRNWIYDKNPNNVKVTVKDAFGNSIGALPYSENDGWSFVDGYQTLNIIECPIHPEINCATDVRGKVLVTGYFIKLNGSARITNPNYLDIFTQTPPEFYGYVKMNFKPWIAAGKPLSESIRVKINGVQIPEGGFDVIEGRSTRNVKIKSPSDFTEDSVNPLIQTGYFLKLKPAFVFGAGDSIQVDYWPSGT